MSSSAAAGPSRTSPKKFDVFISFRGEDTRNNFTSHLHNALCEKKIETYIDYQLRKGDAIWPTLSGAIEDSQISVVIFSKDYASSKWCLEELVKIMECRKGQGQVVIPVFYEVDPSDVRKQTGSYGIAFAKHERDLGDNESNQSRVRRWREALTEAANIAGWDSRSRTHRDDYQVIQNIVNDVWQKLSLLYPKEIKDLVGIDKNCKHIETFLEDGQVIGIWGMAGMGKTTLAKVVFARLFPQYDTICFLENVREQSNELSLNKLLFELLKEHITTSSVIGSTFIQRRLRSTKALIVIDNVDNITQLEYLYGVCGDVGRDSRLIITTRDRQLLTGRANQIYELKKKNFSESLTLFSKNAFKDIRPKKGYEHLSKRAVDYAGGVPLALKVLGAHLHSKRPEIWECELSKLEKCPNMQILNVLKLSYDGLDEFQKAIFLDITFFFKDLYKDYVIRILNACGFYAVSGIDVLEDRALIKISYSNAIEMHDLIQEMGLEIVRQESSRKPGERSRLKDTEEVCDVLTKSKGTETVEGIKLDLSQIEDFRLSADSLYVMSNLRFLNFYIPWGKRSGNVYLSSVPKPFSDKLRYFQWNGYPSKYLPPTFCAKFLVEFRMPDSHVKELWQGMQELVNLVGIDVSRCKQLTKLPDLSRASKLEWLYLSGCESLCDLHPSVISLGTLVTLKLDGCKKLKSLKSEKHSKSLEMLNVDGCSSLKELSVSSDSINKLDLSKTGTEILHSSIGGSSSLMWLNLEGLRLKNLPDELSCLSSLKELRISSCGLVITKQKLHVLFDGLRSLQVLYLKDCCNLSELPDNINVLSKLHELRLDGSSVERLPASIKDLEELEILSLENCGKLLSLPELPPFIKEFYAVNCTSLVTVSTLQTFTAEMKGKDKHISFKNGLNLVGRWFRRIMEGAHSTIMSAAFHNVLVRRYSVDRHSYNYNSVKVCLPGSRVPKQVTYRTTESSITIQLPSSPNLQGFFLSVVISPTRPMTKHGAQIECQCYLADGPMVGYFGSSFDDHKAITDLDSDHVFVWYSPYFCDNVLRTYERQVTFKFIVTSDTEESDDLVVMKECGLRLIYASEFHSFLGELELELDKKVELGLKLGLALDMEQGSSSEGQRLLYAMEHGSELDASLESEYESRRRALLRAIEKETQKHNWKNETHGFKDIVSLFPR